MTYFKPIDVAAIGIFTALWIVLHTTLGPLGFRMLHLPVLCDVSAYLTLILVAWLTNKFGTATLTGIIGSLAVFLLRGSPHIWGFAVSAIIFDAVLLAVGHRIKMNRSSMVCLTVATLAAAYVAGVIIGVVFTANRTLEWALTFWGGWHVVGGILTLVITLPIVGTLEKAGVKTIAKTG